MPVVCAACGGANPEGNRFCGSCGAALTVAAPDPRRERKSVTALFCDLVGFTAASEHADPEDVDAVLTDYFTRARIVVEAYGGVIEKFIGDAVVGVFGAPRVHEDDPERAVRAGLELVDSVRGLRWPDGRQVGVRVGINTGEVLVRLDAGRDQAEGIVVGDAINTASRIQSTAPVMGVAVGASTFDQARRSIDFERLDAVDVKGKSQPVEVYLALGVRSHDHDVAVHGTESRLLGRDEQLRALEDEFRRTVAESSCGVVTVVGEPGLGKSRLVAELVDRLATTSPDAVVRRGRCLAYGHGVTFAPVAEIVRAQVGIHDADPAFVRDAKLDALLPRDQDGVWQRDALRALLGADDAVGATQEESFAAWTRFLQPQPHGVPTVLVVEDVHWAEPALVEFLESLARESADRPLLVLATARPEVLEAPARVVEGARSSVLRLEPLSEEDTVALVEQLLDDHGIPPELRSAVIENSGGNPLFAEEYARLARERDPESAGGAETLLPTTVQAIIAARLDALDTSCKRTLAAASVIGSVFWVDAVASLRSTDVADVERDLAELARRSFVRVGDDDLHERGRELTFWHALVRDVAYGQIPRAERAVQHAAAARWIEAMSGAAGIDDAGVLAHHCVRALELARATGQDALADELVPSARRALVAVGQRDVGLDPDSAVRNLEAALDLTPVGHPERADVLATFSDAAFQVGRHSDALAAVEESVALHRNAGDGVRAAVVMAERIPLLHAVGDPRAFTAPYDMLAVLDPLPPGPDLVSALGAAAGSATFSGRHDEAVALADRALALASSQGSGTPMWVRSYRGWARAGLGDPGGLDDMRLAIDEHLAAGQTHAAAVIQNNLAITLWMYEGPAASLAMFDDALAFARARGLRGAVDVATTSSAFPLIDAGRLDDALAVVDVLSDRLTSTGASRDLAEIRAAEIRVALLRGEVERAVGLVDQVVAVAHESESTEHLVHGLSTAAAALAAVGDGDTARGLLAEVAASVPGRATPYYAALLAASTRVALVLDDPDLASALADGFPPLTPYAEHALVTAAAAVAEHDRRLDDAAAGYADAAARWRSFGVRPELALALLGRGRVLAALGDPHASDVLRTARIELDDLGAVPMVAEVELLLARVAGR